MVIVIVFLLAWLVFCAIMFIWPATLSRRQRLRPFASVQDQGASAQDRGNWGNVREPRHPKPPSWPPQAAAAIPEDREREEPTRAIAFSDGRQDVLRLEDGLA